MSGPLLSNLLLAELREQGVADYGATLKRIDELSATATPEDLCHLGGVLIDIAAPAMDFVTTKRAVGLIEDFARLPGAQPELIYMLGTAYGALSQIGLSIGMGLLAS